MKIANQQSRTLLMILGLMGWAFAAGAEGGGPNGRGQRREPPAEVKAAFQACFAEIGVTVTEGARPSLTEEQKTSLHSCLAAKGVNPPQAQGGRGGPRHRGPGQQNFEQMKACLTAAGVNLPEHKPGERPVLDETTKAAMDNCRSQLRSNSQQESEQSAGSVSSAL